MNDLFSNHEDSPVPALLRDHHNMVLLGIGQNAQRINNNQNQNRSLSNDELDPVLIVDNNNQYNQNNTNIEIVSLDSTVQAMELQQPNVPRQGGLPQRRERQEAKRQLQQNLWTAIEGLKRNDSSVVKDTAIIDVLKTAFDSGLNANSKMEPDGTLLLNLFASHAMVKCFEECLLHGADPTLKKSTELSPTGTLFRIGGGEEDDALSSALNPLNPSASVMRMVSLLLSHTKSNSLGYFAAIRKVITTACFSGVLHKILEKNPNWAKFAVVQAMKRGNATFAILAIDHYIFDRSKMDQVVRENFHQSATFPSSQLCAFFISKGANIEAADKMGETPFLIAVRSKSVNCMNLLIERGCNTKVLNRDLENALSIAINCESLECFKILLSKQRDNFPRDIIRRLVCSDRYEMLCYALINCGASLQSWLTVEILQDLLTEAISEEVKKLIHAKIESVMEKKSPQVKKEEVM